MRVWRRRGKGAPLPLCLCRFPLSLPACLFALSLCVRRRFLRERPECCATFPCARVVVPADAGQEEASSSFRNIVEYLRHKKETEGGAKWRGGQTPQQEKNKKKNRQKPIAPRQKSVAVRISPSTRRLHAATDSNAQIHAYLYMSMHACTCICVDVGTRVGGGVASEGQGREAEEVPEEEEGMSRVDTRFVHRQKLFRAGGEEDKEGSSRVQVRALFSLSLLFPPPRSARLSCRWRAWGRSVFECKSNSQREEGD